MSETRTFSFPGIEIRVYIPDLPADERERRKMALHRQAEKFLQKVEC